MGKTNLGMADEMDSRGHAVDKGRTLKSAQVFGLFRYYRRATLETAEKLFK